MVDKGKTHTLRDEQGRLRSLVKVTHDITDYKRAEEALRECEDHYYSLFNNMLNGFAYCQMHFEQDRPVDFTYLEVNDAFEELTSLKNVVGKKVSEVLPGIRESDPELFEIYGRVALTAIPERCEIYVKALGMWFSISVYSPHREYFVALFEVITEGRLRHLTFQLLSTLEAERGRLALELHDDLGQSLTVLKMKLRAIQRKAPPEYSETKESLERVINFIDEPIEKIRRLSRNLRPSILEDLGLTVAIKYLYNEFCQNIRVTMDIDETKGLFPQEAQLHIYRIFQESFSNIVKYAQASQVSVRIRRQDRSVAFQVQDNGRGFDPHKVFNENIIDRGMGLTAMKERARMLGGSLNIWSQEGQGTKITFVVPLQIK